MKNLILILVTVIITACHHNTATPTPPPPPPSTNTVPTTNLNSYETPLVGNWKMWKSEYSDHTTTIPTSYTDTTSCHLTLMNTPWSGNNYKNCIAALDCNGHQLWWKRDNQSFIDLGGTQFTIQKATNDTLIFYNGSFGGTGGSKYYLWK